MIVEKSVTDPEVKKWTSFMPALLAAITATEGQVLEVGVGHYSTPVLHAICKALCRPLMSIEADERWAQAIWKKTQGYEDHELAVGDYDEMIPYFAKQKWGVAFLDHSPGERRGTDMITLGDSVDFFVIHDFNNLTESAVRASLEGFDFHVAAGNPPTIVTTKKHKIPASILTL